MLIRSCEHLNFIVDFGLGDRNSRNDCSRRAESPACAAFPGQVDPEPLRKASRDLPVHEVAGPIRAVGPGKTSAKDCVNHIQVIANLLAYSYANLHEIESR